ncbi:MAG TPA: 4Fe-4S dicluster domain-containing protein [Geobacteraceae bacterium]|nr:4Fe-4S dicluster domain-containing protein [Geobacteraceae bacterium]
MNNTAQIKAINRDFAAGLDPEGKLRLSTCLQCGKCSSGCTMRLETDILPHRLNRMVLFGMEKELLASKAIWMCVSCQTCVSRCPMKVDTPALIDKLRALAPKAPDQETDRIRIFNREMLKSIRRFGCVYELGLIGKYKMRTLDLFGDLAKLPMMLRKGKLKLLPPKRNGRKAVAAIFKRVRNAGRVK